MDVHNKKARQILVAGGAVADGIRIRIPESMVTRALSLAPRRLTLYNRDKRPAIRAWGHNTYYGGGSDCLTVLDHLTGERREPLLADVVAAAKVMDSLPEFDFVMSLFLPKDVDQRIYDRYQMEVMLNHTTKPIVFVSPDFEGCVAAVKMCEAVAGSADAFRHHPFAICYINVTSGLVANEEALQKCIYLADKGLPQLWIPLNAGGVNAPTTTAGCMASMNAGILLGVVLSQLVREGAPIAVPGWNGGPYNLKTMVGNYVLADEQGVPTTMGRYYDLPVFGLGGSTDAKVLDHQTGMECTISLMTALLHGANIVHDVGFMDSGLQRPLDLGANIVLLSISKFMSGNATILGGAMVGPEPLIEDIRWNTTEFMGSIMPPAEAWNTLQYMETLSMRMQRHSANALAVARYLYAHPRVEQVNYSGLEDHSQHALACRQMSGHGGLLSFMAPGGMLGAATVMNSFELVVHAVTFGTSRSICMHPPTITHGHMTPKERKAAGIDDGLIRFSVGLENSEDIIADLEQALDRV